MEAFGACPLFPLKVIDAANKDGITGGKDNIAADKVGIVAGIVDVEEDKDGVAIPKDNIVSPKVDFTAGKDGVAAF